MYDRSRNSLRARSMAVAIAAACSSLMASTAFAQARVDVSGLATGTTYERFAATTSSGVRSSFSNYGALVDIAAPGSNILSTLNSGTTAPGAESYVSYQGTSMAAPHVSGVVALMQAVSSTPKTPAQIEAILKSTATPFASVQSPATGPGILNARKAVDAVRPPPAPPSNTLTRGVAKTGLAAAAGTWLTFTMTVPTGATNLQFTLSGGAGDADMYVKFGSSPTETAFDCRPYMAAGYTETCTFGAPQAGTYYVRVKAYSAFSGVSLVGNYTANAVQTYTNTTRYNIVDLSTFESPIVVSGRSGNASASTPVTVNIIHTWQGDLKVDLVAPNGTLYNLHNRTGSSTDNLQKTVALNLSAHPLNGTWKLRVYDGGGGDTGYLQNWSIRF